MKNQFILDLMRVNIEDTKAIIEIANTCIDKETKLALLDLVGTYQQRWDDLYKLSWK
jgi:hypothetical protein